VREILIDGVRMPKPEKPRGAVLPVFPGGSAHEVVVILGR
jgi:hypothetical protein